MSLTRRDILKLAGGSALGFVLSPLPWKILDDTSIWSQNTSLIPKLPRGPLSIKYSVCTLCAGGCAVRAKCVNGLPYYLSGVENNPVSHGILCARGIAGHHYVHHPLRIDSPKRFTHKGENASLQAVTLENAIHDISAALNGNDGSVAILDRRPGRIISGVYRQFTKTLSQGVYCSSPSDENGMFRVLQKMGAGEAVKFGYDFENADLVVSFGAPVLDGWGTPGSMVRVFDKRKENRCRLIQIESRQSRTALQADQWIAINPGSEELLALAVANVLIRDHLIDKNAQRFIKDFDVYKKTIGQFAPESIAKETGISSGAIESLAHELAASSHAIVMTGTDAAAGPHADSAQYAAAALNVLLGSIGKRGGIVEQKEIPGYDQNPTQPQRWQDVPDKSIRVLIVDGEDNGNAIPWEAIERKLIPEKSMVISLSPYYDSFAAQADYLIPSPAHFEMMKDVVVSTVDAKQSLGISRPLFEKKTGTEPYTVITLLAASAGMKCEMFSVEESLKKIIAELYVKKKGTVALIDGKVLKTAEFSSADDLWAKMQEGAVWVDDDFRQSRSFTFSLTDRRSEQNNARKYLPGALMFIPAGVRGEISSAQTSPIMSKIYQESELRSPAYCISLNPATASRYGLAEEGDAVVETAKGKMPVRVKINSAIRPDVIEAAVGPMPNNLHVSNQGNIPDLLSLCSIQEDGTWRMTEAKVSKA